MYSANNTQKGESNLHERKKLLGIISLKSLNSLSHVRLHIQMESNLEYEYREQTDSELTDGR